MLDYDRIRWEIDSLSTVGSTSVEPISHESEIIMLQHFNYPEIWSFEGNAGISGESKFGTGCAEFRDILGKAVCTNTTGLFNIRPSKDFEAECFVKADLTTLMSKEHIAELESAKYKFYGGHVFWMSGVAMAWSKAKAICEGMGGHLATSTSAEKNAFLVSFGKGIKLGATDENVEGVWEWITGEEWSYTNWRSSYPQTNSNANYVYMSSSGMWEDTTAGVSGGYTVCEWDSFNAAYLSMYYRFYGGHTFRYFSTTATWSDAKVACENLGGHLATSTNAEKNEFLAAMINSRTWLGGFYEDNEFKWVTGETGDYTNWNSGEPCNTGESTPLAIDMYSSPLGVWNDEYQTTKCNYICEWDYDMREGYMDMGEILSFGDGLTLGMRRDGKIILQSEAWSLDETSTIAMSSNTWHHILLRLSGRILSVYLDGVLAISSNVSGLSIRPEVLILGGYRGYMDEFVFRNGAGTGNPTVPTLAYETCTGIYTRNSNAPVTRAVWTCVDLPEGLTLSADGKLSGRPTTAGTYTYAVQVTTNWGTATKNISIRVTE